MTSFRTKVLLRGGPSRDNPQVLEWSHPEPTQVVNLQLPLETHEDVETLLRSKSELPGYDTLPTDSLESGERLPMYSYLRDTQPTLTFLTEPSLKISRSTTEFTATSRTLTPPSLIHFNSKITSPETNSRTDTYSDTILTRTDHLLSSDSATRPLTTPLATPYSNLNATTNTSHNGLEPAQGTRKLVLACVLGGVLGLVGCAIIGFCLFNLSSWYKNHKKRRIEQILSPSLSPLEKIDSNDPLAQLDNSIEIRRGSMIYISSPLNGDNILRLKGLPPAIPRKNPMRQSQLPLPPKPTFYDFHPRPEIRTPRPAPPPPRPTSKHKATSPNCNDRNLNRTDNSFNEGFNLQNCLQGPHQTRPACQTTASLSRNAASTNWYHEPSKLRCDTEAIIYKVAPELSPNQNCHDGLARTAVDIMDTADFGLSRTSAANPNKSLDQNALSVMLGEPCELSPHELDLNGENRNSSSSSCYSNTGKITPGTPLGDLQLNVNRTSSSSFADVMASASLRFEDSVNAINVESEKAREEVVQSQLMDTNMRQQRVPMSPSPSDVRSLEIYDDGKGSYPILTLQLNSDTESGSEENSLSAVNMPPNLDDLDLFA